MTWKRKRSRRKKVYENNMRIICKSCTVKSTGRRPVFHTVTGRISYELPENGDIFIIKNTMI